MSRRDERGIAAIEFVLVVPVLLLLLALGVVGGRVAKTEGELQSAVRAAARAASVQRSDSAATDAAQQAAIIELDQGGVTCHGFSLTVTPEGAGGVDHVQLSCVVPLDDVAFIGFGASKTMTADFSSPVDTFRQFG
jgi:Flp pilus assembly protein TadG